ncbi:glycosyltransferase [Streptomyces kanasensis]|uniref:glycosyltransferase n=1 Tax=Streptomyces kanasensis TaxID=936756 RepID=UPI0036FBBE34
MTSTPPGRAIIASDLPDLREILQDGVNCLLRPPDDPIAWADAVAHLVTDAVFGRSLADAVRKQFLHRHTWRHRANLVLAGLTTGVAETR